MRRPWGQMEDSNDLILVDDAPAETDAQPQATWRILVVDDDTEVHVATDFALRGVQIFGRRLSLVHARSAHEAAEMLAHDRDFSVILLDVVMETQNAGLAMVGHIRETLAMSQVRIILRTGQPGYAPELTVFNDYDINDYHTKAELTRARLITAISAAIRSYHQIDTVAENKRELEIILRAATELIDIRDLEEFSAVTLRYAGDLLNQAADGVVCARPGLDNEHNGDAPLIVIGATGRFDHLLFRPLSVLETPFAPEIARTVAEGAHRNNLESITLCLNNGNHQGALHLQLRRPPSDTERQCLEVFAAHVAACLGSVRLFEQLNFIAFHDALTRLRNRNRFILDLNEVSSRNAENVVALLDLEHFADLNDGLGHEIGNHLLVAVAQRLEQELGETCLLARIGADVFGIIGPETLVNPSRMFEMFAAPFQVLDHKIPVTVALGLCRMLEDSPSGITLLKRANIALNRAKHDLTAHHAYFMQEMEDNTRWRLEIIHRLREDFSAQRLSVWFQPQIDLASGRLVAIEALLRWPRHDSEGFFQPPAVFVPLAEYSGLIVDIGHWVLEQACAAFTALRDLQCAPKRVSVNVSMAQFRQHDLAHTITEAMRQHLIAPGELELEITESIAMDEPKIVVGTLLAIKATGARIAIDDFGTGFSSLAHLRQLPIDTLKIDKSFIAEIADGRGGMFAETITALGAKLGVSTVAEGVETPEQAGFLRALGCTTGQGYLYAAPMPLAALREWIAARR